LGLLLSALHKDAGEVLAVANGDESLQSYDNDGDDQTAPVHEQMMEENIHDQRGQEVQAREARSDSRASRLSS
jgi:protein required for attachment to host cells